MKRNDPRVNRILFAAVFALSLAFVLFLSLAAFPADIDAAQAVPLLEELVEKLREGTGLSAADVWERLAATVACKAAIKAGWESDAAELTALARRVVSGEITHCPHGRPVMQRFTRAELDKRFGRIT